MKLLKIKFKNINNLKGEHEVDFQSAPLTDAGIFAIVGPTGSGKSTLLDVITLALFNRIPRFSKAISKTEIGSLGSVMTHHTNESSASITYSIKGNTYTSEWNIAEARTGNLKDYEMFLYDASGKSLDLKKSEVPGKNEEIIGLKYDQFIKSIILSQGEFAKFLKADKNERGQLLENITGTAIYRKLGKAAYQKQKEIKGIIDQENAIKEEQSILTEEERKAIVKNLEELEASKKNLDKNFKNLNDLKVIKQELKTATKALESKKVESIEIAKKIAEYAPIFAKLVIHDKITPLREDHADYKTATDNANRSAKNLADYTATYKQGEEILSEVIKDMSILCKVKVDQKNFKSAMSKFELTINQLDNDLKHLKQKGIDERNFINEKKANYSIELSDKETANQAIKLLSDHQKKLSSFLAKNKIKLTASSSEIREQITEQTVQLSLLRDLKHNYEHISTEEKKIKTEVEKEKKLKAQQKALKPLLKKDEEHLLTLREKLDLLQKRQNDLLKIADLEDMRISLRENDPCPLCGSLDHPYTKHLETPKVGTTEKAINKVKEDIKTKHMAIEQSIKELSSTTTALGICTERIAELKANLKEGITHSETLVKQYSGKEKITQKNIDNLYLYAKQQLEVVENAAKSLEELGLNKELLKAYERLEKIGVDYSTQKDKRKEVYDGDDAIAYSNQLQDKFVNGYTSMEKSKTAIEKETKDLKGAKKLLESLGKKLSPKLAALGFNSLDEIGQSILDEKQVEAIKVNREALNNFQTKNTTEITTLRNKISESKKKDNEPEVELESIVEKIETLQRQQDHAGQTIGEYKSQLKRDDKDKAKVKAKQEQIKKLEKDYEKWSLINNLIGDATGNKFANFSQGLTLQNLLVYTNKRLVGLTDRYLIDKPSEDGTLKVIDQYQGNTQRAVSTLSGGETFLISLALALSLSDMASKNVALDCLFIDEGFGTLDQDTLDVAMNTLEKLQSESQKTVGVISHVDTLKERINVQIVLEKDNQGYSKIRIDS